MQLGESPLWHPGKAALYWIDIPGCAVHRLHPESGAHHSWAMPAEPGCIAYRSDGGLMVALRGGIAKLDTSTGELTMLVAAPYDTGTTRFNDGRCDPMGRFWLGTIYEPRDKALAALYCLDRGILRPGVNPVTVSNGVAFSKDGTTLYHADTAAHTIRAYAFEAKTGVIGSGVVLHHFNDDRTSPDYGGRPDGAAVDSEGAYWCAMFEGGRLLRLSPSGDILQEISLPLRCPTMMAFGGEDLRTLYVTSARHNRGEQELERFPLSGCVLSIRVDVPGRSEPAYQD